MVYETLSLAAETGKTLALVGPSGGGKSTITKLLLRFYDPTAGTITLDNVNIKTLNIAWYRHQVGRLQWHSESENDLRHAGLRWKFGFRQRLVSLSSYGTTYLI